jgi:magnesium transporter
MPSLSPLDYPQEVLMDQTATSRAEKIGLPPGTLIHVGEPQEEAVVVSVIDYDAGRIDEKQLDHPGDIRAFLDRESVTWVNLTGVHDVASVGIIGSILGVHPLVLEDVVNTHQRPKAEAYDDHLFVVLKMIRYDADASKLDLEQVSLILGKGYVITFQEKPRDVFDPVRERIRKGKGRLRKSGADYLAYALLDVVVDHYFLALEALGSGIEDLEEDLISRHDPGTLHTIHSLKQVMVTLRKAVWPMREMILSLERTARWRRTEMCSRDTWTCI